MHLHLPLNLLSPALRVDWPLLLSAIAVGITLLGSLTLGLQIRRTRRRVLMNLERVFEELDLLRLEAQPETAAAPALSPAVQRSAPTPASAAPPAGARQPFVRAPQAPAELVDYQAAARLAARGAPLAEIAERCGVVAGEARVLMALQRGAQQRRAGAR
jgi:hypothetical protein